MAISEQKVDEQAVQAFEKLGVCRQLAEAAASLGWKAPTSVQEQAVPHLLAGEHPGQADDLHFSFNQHV
jgi:ATP-dependent RNA helicase DDX47/RRP3